MHKKSWVTDKSGKYQIFANEQASSIILWWLDIYNRDEIIGKQQFSNKFSPK